MTEQTRETQISSELQGLQRQDGSWAPEDVVDFAKSHKRSALHGCFNWNKDAAAMEHWLLTARHLIKQYVVVVERHSKDVTIGTVYSVPSKRRDGEGSYVSEASLKSNDEWRHEVLHEVTTKLRTMKIRYEPILPELKAVWKAIK